MRSDAADWFAGRLPDDWFAGDPEVIVDREEITVIGRLPEPEDAESEGPRVGPGGALPRADAPRTDAHRRRSRGAV